MANISTYLENKLVDHSLGTTTYTKPTAVYVALMTVMPTSAGGGTEVTGGSYARQAMAFSAASSGSATNSGTVTFSGMPAATVLGIGIYDASTAGNLLWFEAFGSSIAATAGSSIVFNASSVTQSIS